MSILTLLLAAAALLGLQPGPAAAAGAAVASPPHWSAPVAAALQEAGIVGADPRPGADPRLGAASGLNPDAPLPAATWALWLCRTVAWPDPGTCPADPGGAAIRPLARVAALAQAVEHAPARYGAGTLPPDAATHPRAGVLATAVAAGLLRGDPNGNLAPDRPLTVAEGLTVAGRLLVNRLEGQSWRLEPDRQGPADRLRLLLHPELAGPHRYVRVVRTGPGGGETLVAGAARVAEGAIARMVGAESGLGDGLLLRETAAIHTRWGPVPLDVVFVDAAGVILGTFAELPRGMVRGVPGAQDALELPGGRIRALGLAAGQQLRFEAVP